MPDPNPNVPGGAVPPVPPKAPEAAKVQPKKETVRISLPPKPTSSPTIKLPTLPAGGPAAPSASPGASPAPAAPAPARPPTSSGSGPALVGAPAARPPTSTGGPVSRPASAAPAAGHRPMPSAPVRKVSGLDVGLGIAAAVIGLGAVVCVLLLLQLK